MDLKLQVLGILELNRGTNISGVKLAEELYVTRSAIWKAIKALQKDGYDITAVTNKGYCLNTRNDIVSAESILPFLQGDARNFTLEVYKQVTSTNTIAKELASKGVKEGTVIVANEQTEGRGRMGRSFYSPTSTGIYFSIILRPKLSLESSLLITTSIAVAVAQAIESMADVKAEIKWVNDIFVNGKKVCGILTEASLNFENGGLEYAVVGIGINISTNVFPEEITSVAGSIFVDKPSHTPITSRLVAEVLNNISSCLGSLTSKEYLAEYRKRSFLLGQEIMIIRGNTSTPALAIDIDDKAQLIVEYSNKERAVLTSGEVSVRRKSNE